MTQKTPIEVAEHILGKNPIGMTDYGMQWVTEAIVAAIQAERDEADRRVKEARGHCAKECDAMAEALPLNRQAQIYYRNAALRLRGLPEAVDDDDT